MKRVFLIGMPAAGKSQLAARTAAKLNMQSYDLDRLVEALEDETIADIFSTKGEEHFRNIESKVLRWFSEKKQFVLATGGGTACFKDNIKWMNKQGITIWIDEPTNVLVDRVCAEKDERPLLSNLTKDQLKEKLERLLHERRVYYEQAQYHLSSPNISVNRIVEIITNHA